MKRILITGANSYIGTSFEKWVSRYPHQYIVDTLDMKNDTWKEKDFSFYDVIFHVAGIAHVSTNPKMKQLYFKVNRDLAVATAQKAKVEGVKQFIFMSSIIVYGDCHKSNTLKTINKDTIPTPTSFYGESKLQAEVNISELATEKFNTAIIRAPMIYGKDSKGNYMYLSKLARCTPIFPNYKNKRSMLYIDNLCEFVRLIIGNFEKGIFFPQNDEYVRTSEMVKIIREVHGKKIIFTKFFNPIIKLLSKKLVLFDKAFGDLCYEMKLSRLKENYRIVSYKESILRTEK